MGEFKKEAKIFVRFVIFFLEGKASVSGTCRRWLASLENIRTGNGGDLNYYGPRERVRCKTKKGES